MGFGLFSSSGAKATAATDRATLEALSRSQAMIEFSLEGAILSANQNFLNALGYRLEEVVGQHHRIFVEPAYASSAEYRAFWERLRKGEYDAAEYKRLGKGGKEVWIQASYNPIMDAKGRPYKVVKFATDITATFKGRQLEADAVVDDRCHVLGAPEDVDDVDLLAGREHLAQMVEVGDAALAEHARHGGIHRDHAIAEALQRARHAVARARGVGAEAHDRDDARAAQQRLDLGGRGVLEGHGGASRVL